MTVARLGNYQRLKEYNTVVDLGIGLDYINPFNKNIWSKRCQKHIWSHISAYMTKRPSKNSRQCRGLRSLITAVEYLPETHRPIHREGNLRGLTIIIEFDDMNAARGFYESEAYTAARAVRETAAETDLMLVDGI